MSVLSGAIWIALLSSLTAMALSLWIWRQTSGTGGLPGCGSGSACEAVTRGRWSKVGPVSVSFLGVLLYASMATDGAMLALALRSPKLPAFAAAAAWCVLLAAIWFFFLQMAVVRRFCIYCSLVHACAIVGAVCLMLQPAVQAAALTIQSVMISVIAVTLLIVAQVSIRPKLYAVLPGDVVRSSSDVGKASATEREVLTIGLLNDQVRVDLETWPVLGTQDASHVIAWLFDFTCKECHRLHTMLREAIAHYQGRLAVVAIPVPPHASGEDAEKAGVTSELSLVLTRLALAMWTANPSKYDEWDRFMAEPVEMQQYLPALKKAQQLAEIDRMAILKGNTELDQKVAATVDVLHQAGSPKQPALILPRTIVVGRVPDVATLIQILDTHVMQLLANQPRTVVSV